MLMEVMVSMVKNKFEAPLKEQTEHQLVQTESKHRFKLRIATLRENTEKKHP